MASTQAHADRWQGVHLERKPAALGCAVMIALASLGLLVLMGYSLLAINPRDDD